MSILLERSDQALPITEISRSAKKVMDDFQSGEKSKCVIMRNNTPAAVMLNVSYYEELMDLIDDLRTESIAVQRLKTLEATSLISHEDMLKRFEEN